MSRVIKRVLITIVALCVLLLGCPLTAFSASDFEVKNGVLLSYTGSEKSVTIPTDVYYIADSAFEGNSAITAVNLSNTAVIGNKAFANCTSLKVVTNTDSISSCGAYAFYNTPFQSSYSSKSMVLGSVLVYSDAAGGVVIDSSVVSIAPYAFSSNDKVTSVFIGDSVSSIGEGAFYNCDALKSVTVGKYVSYIGAFAFEGTSYLSSVEDDFLVLGKGILVDANTAETDVLLPDNVKQIAAGAFYNNKNIQSVVLHEGISSVGMRAFAGCTSLTTVALPSSLVSLDKEAFSGCTSLQTINVPKGVKLIGEGTFLGCTKLESAVISSGADIPSGIFAGCTSLEYVALSEGTTIIGDNAFYNCSQLKELSVPPTVRTVEDSAFRNTGDFSVWCKKGSYIDSYCENLGISAYSTGDANLDGNVNIRDATEIQKATAKLLTLNVSATLRGDADFSGDINVRDATAIQKITAGIV